jgi:hypothetical protein
MKLIQRLPGLKTSGLMIALAERPSMAVQGSTLPATVVAELGLNSVIPPPDMNKEGKMRKEISELIILKTRQVTLRQLNA